jgi:hypothetical protein
MGRRSEHVLNWQIAVLTFAYRLVGFCIGLSDAMPYAGARRLP